MRNVSRAKGMGVHVGPPAADFPSVPVGKPQRAQQILRPSLKTQGWGKKVTQQAAGFQETGEERCPHLASIMGGMGYCALNTTHNGEFHAKRKEVWLMDGRK